jgi:two-component sensor histidine kinase
MAETQNRVRAMSFVHEKLYQSESLSHIDLSDYLEYLTAQLFNFYGIKSHQVTLEVSIDSVMVDINAAIPLGLIVNELISNALKHAFPEGGTGTIRVTGRYEDGTLTLLVMDDGTGMPPDLDWKNTDSLGFRLVTSLVDQLNGTIEREPGKGTCFRIAVKRELGINRDIYGTFNTVPE